MAILGLDEILKLLLNQIKKSKLNGQGDSQNGDIRRSIDRIDAD